MTSTQRWSEIVNALDEGPLSDDTLQEYLEAAVRRTSDLAARAELVSKLLIVRVGIQLVDALREYKGTSDGKK